MLRYYTTKVGRNGGDDSQGSGAINQGDPGGGSTGSGSGSGS